MPNDTCIEGLETAHVMLYVTPLRGDVGAFRRRSTMLTASFHERTSIYRTTGTVPSHYRCVEYSHFELYTWIPRNCTVNFACVPRSFVD